MFTAEQQHLCCVQSVLAGHSARRCGAQPPVECAAAPGRRSGDHPWESTQRMNAPHAVKAARLAGAVRSRWSAADRAAGAAQATSSRHYGEKDARLEYLSWRVWHLKRKKHMVRREEIERRARAIVEDDSGPAVAEEETSDEDTVGAATRAKSDSGRQARRAPRGCRSLVGRRSLSAPAARMPCDKLLCPELHWHRVGTGQCMCGRDYAQGRARPCSEPPEQVCSSGAAVQPMPGPALPRAARARRAGGVCAAACLSEARGDQGAAAGARALARAHRVGAVPGAGAAHLKLN